MFPQESSSSKKLWPVWVAFGLPLLLILLNSMPFAMDFVFVVLGIPALLFVWCCLGIWSLVLTVRRCWRRQFSRAVVSAILPLVIFGAGLRFRGFINLCNVGGDVLHFMFVRSAYLKEIRNTPSNGEPRLIIFNRGGMIWASRGYVYDESDEVVREGSLRSASWKARADGTELTCGYDAEPFPGGLWFSRHWYIASFNC